MCGGVFLLVVGAEFVLFIDEAVAVVVVVVAIVVHAVALPEKSHRFGGNCVLEQLQEAGFWRVVRPGRHFSCPVGPCFGVRQQVISSL